MRLIDALTGLGDAPDSGAIVDAFLNWAETAGIALYPHQEEALLEIADGSNAIITTPTGSGKSLIALAAHFRALAVGGVSFYTAPLKALVSEKFFALCDAFGAENVGMVTGDASVNADAPIICCTAEILANIALREGRDADVENVVMDEFHFIAERDRGWAWLTGIIELPQAQHILMSATLGDVTELRADLTRRTGRDTAVIGGAERPVPLEYRWAMTPVHETVEEIIRAGQAPVYIVHSTQAAALERAQALLSATITSKEERDEIREAIGGFRFGKGFGQTLKKLVHAGIGVHHAGLLPRYRRLVETLAQRGLLKVICGTDTLGVGINVPIRTVLFTALTKFDGNRMRLMKSREFHQIAGRAGRAGFDTVGYVVAQAPDHVIENERALAKAGDDPKKRRKVQRKKPPEGFVNWTEDSFEKLIASVPETLTPRMRITHSTLLNLLERDRDTVADVSALIDEAANDDADRRRLRSRALALGRSLIDSGTVIRLPEPEPTGRRYRLAEGLSDAFALNQPLSEFAMAAIEILDPESATYALDVVSLIESTLENPMAILLQQQFAARGEAVAAMKADGVEYDDRMEALEEVEWPKPLEEIIAAAYEAYLPTHPWIAETPPAPKSIVRDMIERSMTFGEFVSHYKLQRSEGVLLRYLTDAYRALRQSVPERFVTDELDDLIEWLGEMVRLTDSSLVAEWEAMTAADAADDPEARMREITDEASAARTITANPRSFRVLVRSAMWRRIELMARDDVDALASLDENVPDAVMTYEKWDEALEAYWAEHDEILTDADARGPSMIDIADEGRTWRVTQTVSDPAGHRDWRLHAEVDLDASDEADELVLRVTGFERM